MSFELTPCESWTTEDEVMAYPAYADLDPDTLALTDPSGASVIDVASEILFVLSGNRFTGECSVTVRPLPTDCIVRDGRSFVYDTRMWPVKSVTSVVINGSPVDVSGVSIDDGRWLVRTDGGVWPLAQRLDLPTTQVGTWAITVVYGESPPPSGKLAARVLAGELALSIGTDEQRKCCRLSKRVQNVTRQGVSMVLLDPFQFLDKGRLGIFEVDSFLMTHNPEGLRGEPTVSSPDYNPTLVRRTWH